MSTILKALRRLEDKKAAAAERPLRDEVVVSTGRRRGRGGLASAIAAGVALAFTGLVLLWALDPESDFDAPVPASSEPAVSAAPEPAPPEDPYAETAPSAEALLPSTNMRSPTLSRRSTLSPIGSKCAAA